MSRTDSQSNTYSDAEPVVERQQGTIDLDGDDQTRVDGGQGISFEEDAFPPELDTGEQLPLEADVITVEEAADQNLRGHALNDDDEADSTLPDTSGDTEADARSPEAPETPHQPRQRRRRMLPTPPIDIIETKRVRKPPVYLKDYVAKQAIGRPLWIQKVDWLTTQLQLGIFKGMENEITRTIMEIVKTS